MIEAGNPEKIGELNRKLILDCVRKYGPISRADLQRHLSMSFPTISTNVKKMLEGGYLLEAGSGDNKLGRKSTLLSFNARRAFVVGVDMGRSQLRVMLADLDGSELAYSKEKNEGDIALKLSGMIAGLVQETGVDPALIRCICIGHPGVRDAAADCLRIAPFFPTRPSEIERQLRTDYPSAEIITENAVNFGAVGEKWHGAARDYRDIVYIDYGVGIGAALVLNGELYRGVNGAAGEIGFMLPESGCARQTFDEQGVLEELVSGRQVDKMLENKGLGSDIREALKQSDPGNSAFSEILQKIISHIGTALVNITAVFNEEIIVIGGGLGDALGEELIPAWTDMLKKHVPFVPKIVRTQLGSHANMLGAVAVAIRHVNDEVIS